MVYSSLFKCPTFYNEKFFIFLIKRDFQYIFFFSTKVFDFNLLFSSYYSFFNLFNHLSFKKGLNQRKKFIYLISRYKSFLTVIEQKLESTLLSISKGYTCFLEIRGRNFKVLYLKKHLLFLFGFSHFILYPIPKFFLILNIQQRSTLITVFSFHLNILKNFVQLLFRLKIRDVYKGKGLFFFKEHFFLKVGKKKDFF